MPTQWHADDELVDPKVSCSDCAAVCCRLTVAIMPADTTPQSLLTRTDTGLLVMARGAGGWCIALNHKTMTCGIYSQRPESCRRFTMGSGYCRSERAIYASDDSRLAVTPDVSDLTD